MILNTLKNNLAIIPTSSCVCFSFVITLWLTSSVCLTGPFAGHFLRRCATLAVKGDLGKVLSSLWRYLGPPERLLGRQLGVFVLWRFLKLTKSCFPIFFPTKKWWKFFCDCSKNGWNLFFCRPTHLPTSLETGGFMIAGKADSKNVWYNVWGWWLLSLSLENRAKGSKKDGMPLPHSLFFRGWVFGFFQGG